jgi:hypothetical protein
MSTRSYWPLFTGFSQFVGLLAGSVEDTLARNLNLKSTRVERSSDLGLPKDG